MSQNKYYQLEEIFLKPLMVATKIPYSALQGGWIHSKPWNTTCSPDSSDQHPLLSLSSPDLKFGGKNIFIIHWFVQGVCGCCLHPRISSVPWLCGGGIQIPELTGDIKKTPMALYSHSAIQIQFCSNWNLFISGLLCSVPILPYMSMHSCPFPHAADVWLVVSVQGTGSWVPPVPSPPQVSLEASHPPVHGRKCIPGAHAAQSWGFSAHSQPNRPPSKGLIPPKLRF